MASIFAVACGVTIFTRIHGGYHTLKQQETDANNAEPKAQHFDTEVNND